MLVPEIMLFLTNAAAYQWDYVTAYMIKQIEVHTYPD